MRSLSGGGVKKSMGRAGIRAVVAMAALVPLVLGPTAAAADIPPPPRTKLNVHSLKVVGTWDAAGNYCRITASAAGLWKQAPRPVGLTAGHYLRVKIEVIAPAGYGGTLVKSLAKAKARSDTFAVPHVGLPRSFTWSVNHNARFGSGDYGARITVRVVRHNAGVDTTAWKLVAATPFTPVMCVSRGGK